MQLVQFPIEGGHDFEAFWQKVDREVTVGVKQKADVVVFPELISLDMWPRNQKTTAADELKITKNIAKWSGVYIDRAKALAKKYKLLLIAGSTPRMVGKKLLNTVVIAKPDGQVILQNKTHLTKWEKDLKFSPGDSIHAVKMPWGTFVVLVCYESEIPSLSQQIAKFKPQIIFVPSMTDDKAGRTRVRATSQARSVEHLAYVALTGTVGRKSQAFANDGQAVVFAPPVPPFTKFVLKKGRHDQPESIFVELDFTKITEARRSPPVYPGRDQREVQVR